MVTGNGTEDGFKEDDIQNGNDYLYDSNGNMIEDANKGITSIEYNHLNLPTKVLFNTGNAIGSDEINYIYDATGVKLAKKVLDMSQNNNINSMNVNTTEYTGGYIYTKSGNYSHNGTYWVGNETDDGLQFLSQPEGYVEPSNDGSGNYNYVYQYKDHLGNIRLSYMDNNGSLEIIEENNYYPFGLKHKGYNDVVSANVNSVASKFKYNGMELEESLGVDWYEMDLRQYDPAIARWTSIDPVTHFEYSTYSAFDNNPIYWADPSGADSTTYTGEAAQEMFRRIRDAYGNSSNSDASSNNASSGDTDPKNPFAKMLNELKSSENGINPNFANGAAMSTYNGSVRIIYALKTYQLKSLYNSNSITNWQIGMDSRYKYKLAARNYTTPAWRNLLNLNYPVESLTVPQGATKSPTRFFKTSLGWNIAGGASAATGVFGLGVSGYNIYNAENKGEQIAIEGGSWGGAWFGAELAAGFAMSHFPNPWYVGAWTVVGGFAGGIYGRQAVETMIENAKKPSTSSSGKCNCSWDHTCFVAGTKVMMKDGSEKNIENIKEGDLILSVNIETMKIESDIVLNIPVRVKKYRKIRMELENGITNEFSPAHPFWVENKGWAVFDIEEAKTELKFSVDTLQEGDIVIYYNGGNLKRLKIIKLDDTEEFVEMYNVENVKKNNTFFANGILVHNKFVK